MKRLFFIRHAETEMNVAGIFSGQVETSLTKKGRQQAKKAAVKLQANLPPIDLIVSSPLERTRETARIIAHKIGYPEEKVVYNSLFVERSYGVLDGKPSEEYLKSHSRKDIDQVDKAETIEELQIRANKALKYLQTLPEDNILVVSHGAFGRALKRSVDGHPHTHEYLAEYHIRIGNAEIVELI